MPRTGKGGPRELPIGEASGNRTDMNAHLPVETGPSRQYGERAAQEVAQRAVPLAPTPAEGAAPAPTSVAPSEQPSIPLAQSLARAAPKAGSLPFLGPTDRPNEPVTAGLPFGAGPGPEVMNQGSAIAARPVTTAFDELAQSPNATPAVSSLADTARLLGL